MSPRKVLPEIAWTFLTSFQTERILRIVNVNKTN